MRVIILKSFKLMSFLLLICLTRGVREAQRVRMRTGPRVPLIKASFAPQEIGFLHVFV